MNTRKRAKGWISEGLRPALCFPSSPSRCPFGCGPCGADVKLWTITGRRVPGYNIREESLTRGGAELLAPGPLPLRYVLNAAGMLPPYTLADWYPLELQERWAERHAEALAELRRDGPLTEFDPARRRELYERAFARLKPARPWFFLKELIEPGDVPVPADDRGPARRKKCCMEKEAV